MNISPKDPHLRILFALGGCVAMTIILVLMFGFEIDTDNKQHETVGFIILGDINEAGWNASHYNGIKAACDKFGIKLLVRDNVKENSAQCVPAIKGLIDEGVGMIFLTSYFYATEAKETIDNYPNIAFATNSAEVHSRNITSCFARMYQGRYLCGALAGMKTKSNVIGYVAAMPNNSEVCRGINAFTLGVQRTNPKAKVLVMWTGDWENEQVEAEHTRRLIKQAGADVLTYHQDEATVANVAEELGVDFIAYNAILDGYSEHYLTSLVCRWDLFYQDIIQRYLKGELSSLKNHWVGVQEGTIVLSDYSAAVTPEMQEKIESLKQELVNGKFIFQGPLYDNKGNLQCAEGDVISDRTLLERINWLVKGVEILE